MKLFDIFKKKKEEETKPLLSEVQRKLAIAAINGHKARISNLIEELERLTIDLSSIDTEISKTKAEKNKKTDNIIRRMTLIKYEIDIREELIKWLS